MRTCPKCGRTYQDETMRFCLDDGSSLEGASSVPLNRSLAEPTLRMPVPTAEQPQTIRATQPAVKSFGPEPIAAAHESRAGGAGRDRGMLWIVIALIIGASAVVVAFILTRSRHSDIASVSPPVSSSPSPSQSINATAPDSSKVEAPKANRVDLSQVNRQVEKTSPSVKATPLPKPTPAKTKTEEAPAASRVPVSGGVLNGKAVHLVQPPYPAIARAVHASGTVTVQVLIDESGNVVAAHATSGHPLLQSAAVNAARSSKFTPTSLGGQPVRVSGVIIYNFVAQ